MRKNIILLSVIAILPIANLFAQCAQTSNIYTFTYGSHTYEVVKELKNWTDAKACAIERGGYLVAIETAAEKDYIMGQLMLSTAANIAPNYHPVTDGGGASYIWTGGSDVVTEGTWIWQGSTSPFYIGQGTAGSGGGTAVGGAYVNWGNVNGSEPDNFVWAGSDQDGLGIAMNSWPHGVAGQWNDISVNNTLYFIIEKNNVSVQEFEYNKINIYPNPANDFIKIEGITDLNINIIIVNIDGKKVIETKFNVLKDSKMNINKLPQGVYFVNIISNNNKRILKFIK